MPTSASRHPFRSILLAAAAALAAVAFTSPQQARAVNFADPVAGTRYIGQQVTYHGFLSYRSAHLGGPYPWTLYNWNTDGCSVPWVLQGITEPFFSMWTVPCVQHDFCWRNGKKYLPNVNGADKKACDDRFQLEMKRRCAEYYTANGGGIGSIITKTNLCYERTNTFYVAVRAKAW